MGDFKSQVEEIVGCRGIPCPDKQYENEKSCTECMTKRILAAHNAELDRIAEGMGIVIGGGDSHWNNAVKDCQAYIQAQKGS